MSTARNGHTATLLPNDKVLVAGGRKGNRYLASVELYDSASGTWTRTSSLATARGDHTATLLPSGEVLAAGGTNFVSGALSSAELYMSNGGGIPCSDLLSFEARCKSTGGGHKLQARVTLTDTSHSGEQVTITVDGNPTPVTINGDRAQLSLNNPTPGEHTIELTDPAGCFPPSMPSCE